MSNLHFIAQEGSAGIQIESVRVIMDGKDLLRQSRPATGATIAYPLPIPENAQGNNDCRLIIRARNPGGSSGRVELIHW